MDWLRLSLQSLPLLVCLAFFLIQARQELEKYLAHLTAIALRTESDPDMSYPVVVVCSRQIFRTGGFILTYADYEEAAFSFGEIFENGSFYPSGRCYKIEAGPDLGMVHDQYIGIGLKTELSKVSVHLIERGQDLCLNFQECPDSFETIYPEDDTFEYTVSIMKRVRADRNCGVPTTVEEYSCLTEARDRMLDTHLACFPPLIYRHMARYPWATRAECTDEQSVKETRAQVLKLRSFNASGNNCPAACQKWRYRALPRKYSHAALQSMFGVDFGHSLYLTFRSPVADVEEEFVVYDASGIVAALGGSLGLFLGVSFLDFGGWVADGALRGFRALKERKTTT